MPIYEYKCEDCGEQFEELVFDDSDAVSCPKCSGSNTGKLLSCCRFKTGGITSGEAPAESGSASSAASSSPCAGCSGGDCSSCG